MYLKENYTQPSVVDIPCLIVKNSKVSKEKNSK